MGNPVTATRSRALLAHGMHWGFAWEVSSNNLGYRCGYLRIPAGHPWYGCAYDDIAADVHGGLTFSQPDDVDGGRFWWVGFDCAHYMDAPDPLLLDPQVAPYLGWVLHNHGTVRSTEYVADQCRHLADQAAALPVHTGPVFVIVPEDF